MTFSMFKPAWILVAIGIAAVTAEQLWRGPAPTASWVLFTLGVCALTSALIVRSPPRWPGPVALFGFVWSWLAGELAWHSFVVYVVATGIAIGFGALASLVGVVGLLLVPLAYLPIYMHLQNSAVLGRLEPELADLPPIPRWNRFVFFTYRTPQIRRTRHRYGPARANVADVYQSASATKPGPVLVYVHGGGWVLGFRRWQGRILFRRLVAAGWSVISIEYHLSPIATWPSHIVDVKRAIAWARANPELTGGDAERIAIAGNSAGGHLASLAALTPGLAVFQPGFEDADTSVSACLSWYGVYDILDRHNRWSHKGLKRLWELLVVKKSIANAPETFRMASPLEHALSGTNPNPPPFLLIHGTCDTLVPPESAEDFAAALGGAEIVFVHGAQHAFDVFWSPRAALAVELGARWLERTMATSASPIEESAVLAVDARDFNAEGAS